MGNTCFHWLRKNKSGYAQERRQCQLSNNIPNKFRSDINGLRAWAVVAVVLYHFGIPGFNGGFIGVDVFFVISGFLMTGIIITGFERGDNTFSIWQFYVARARRIVPALIALCAVLLFAGWFALAPVDYDDLGTHILFTLSFLSNIKFWHETGYFDAASHEKWLLHTWSLSVEWQFYLLLPLALLLLWKIKPNRSFISAMVLAGFALSLALSIVFTPLEPVAAFYLLPARAWQLLAGGLVYLLASHLPLSMLHSKLMEASGLILIMLAIFTFDSSTPWPGWQAILPVTGAVLVLLANRSTSPFSNNTVAQWLGTRSYSIYLWHWPLVVALFYLQKQNEPLMIASGILLTIAISHVSYSFIEEPARRLLNSSHLKTVTYLLAITASLLIAAMLVNMNNGFAFRVNGAVQAADAERKNLNPRTTECNVASGTQFKLCPYGGKNIKAIVLGDSHANAIVTAIAKALPMASSGLLAMSYAGCPTMTGAIKINRPEIKCSEFNAWASETIAALPADIPLIIINRTTAHAIGKPQDNNRPAVYFTREYKTATPEFIHEFQNKLIEKACEYAGQRTVYMLRPIPEMNANPAKMMARTLMWGYMPAIFITTENYHDRHDFVWQAQDEAAHRCGIKMLDPLPFLCPDGKCHAIRNNRSIYFDDDHLSEYGNQFLIPLFKPVFEEKAQ